MDHDSLLIILPLSVHKVGQEVWIEQQAANGLIQWLNNFSMVTVGLKLLPGKPASGSVAISSLRLGDRLFIELFDPAWTPLKFLHHYPRERKRLGMLIEKHHYLHFAIGGAWGDWGAIGALEAAKKGRKFSVWTDRVESIAMHQHALKVSGLKRIVRSFYAYVAQWLERRVICKSTVGLFHGMNTYEVYKDFCSNPQLVHDIHLKPSDHIDPQKLNQKLIECSAQPLEIIYAGRIHPDKAPLEWIETLRIVHNSGVDFQARWFGTGPLEREAKSLVQKKKLTRNVHFLGNIVNRAELFNQLRLSHIMVFCHVTPESPRCLIEALAFGTPIVGYESAYAQDLIAKNGGGRLSAMNPAALAGVIIEIARDPGALRHMIEAAASAGAHFNDVDVFAHRAELMKKYS